MRISDRNKETVRDVHLLVKLIQIILRKVYFVEHKVHVLLGMLNVHPEDINRKTKLCEVSGTLSE